MALQKQTVIIDFNFSGDPTPVYFVYRYIRLDTNLPFYVGKGKENRARRIWYHNQRCRRIAEKHGYEIEYILEGLTENKAIEKEAEFISLYKDLGYCEANFTLGGIATAGYRHTEDAKKRITAAVKGKKYSLGCRYKKAPFTKEHCENISKGKKGKMIKGKKVICLNNCVTYISTTQAAICLGVPQTKVSSVCLGNRKHTKGYKFKYVD